MFLNSAIISSSFMQDGIHTQGNSMPPKLEKSERSMLIENAMETIDQLAKDKNLDSVVTVMLSKSVPNLQMYIMGQKENPQEGVNGLVLQAALLRMADTAVIASNLDVNDYTATCLLEQSEDQNIKRGHYNSKYILPYETQAAINFVIDQIIEKHKASGGSGKMVDIITEIKANQAGNYFDGLEQSQSFYTPKSGVTYMNDHPNITNYDVIKGDQLPLDTNTQTLTGTKTGGILDFIDKTVGVIQTAPGTVTTAINAAGDALDKLKDTVSDVGGDIAADSLKKAIVKNLPLIAGVVIGLALIIIFISYVAKHKNK